jgi:sirohydrochlorin ferrochelatase
VISLLVVAHGSRRQASNDEVRGVVSQLRAVESRYERIDCAFLELAEPSIPDGLRTLVRSGANRIVVLPYFLAAGRHVVTDIPAEVAVVRQEYPALHITIAPYLGCAPGIADLMLTQAAAAGSGGPAVSADHPVRTAG